MQKLPSGAMLAVALSEEEAGKLRSVSVAAVNAPGMVVLSGTHAAIDEVARELQSRGVPATKLHTSHAFHSEMMEPILDELRAVVGKVALSEPRIPYVSNLTGTWISAAEATDPGYWARHLRQPVRFGAGVAELLSEPDRVLLEVGPGRALSSFAKKHGQNVHERVFTSLEPTRDGASELESFLHALGRLYLADVAIDWKAYYAAEERRRVPLPTYPFERQPYLRELDATFLDAARNANPLAKRRKVEEWLYLPSWKRAAAVTGEAAAAERWLVFAEGAPLGAALAEALERSASDKIVVTPGEAFGQPGPGRFTLRPSEREDYVRLLETISASGPLPDRVLHLWTLPAAAKAKPEERFEALQLRGFLSLLFLARAFAEKAPEHEVRVGVVTTEVASVMGDEPLTPDKATLLAACQVIPQEHARVSCRLLDVTGAAGTERALAARLLGELRADAGEPVVAYRGSHRWVASYEPAASSAAPSGPRLRDGGVYLIAGGLGGLGLSFAEHLARAVKARLVLTSRTGLVRRDEWDAWLRSHNPNDRVSRIIQRIRGLEALGAEVLILSADVADRDQMAEAVAEARRHFGALHGVIHAAGVMGSEMFRAVRDTAPEHCYAHFRPKAQGLFVLDEVLPEGLDFCLLSSSLATVVGGVGFAAYAAANHFMDAFALERNRNGARFPWISVDWDAWQGGGGAEEKGALAAISIRPEEGGEALRAILALGGEQVVVSTVQLDARRAHLKSFQDAAVAKSKEGTKPGATHARPELDTEYVAPRNELEKMLAELWQELLGISPIGVNDNFFRLGGDSLMAIQLATRLRDTLGVDVPVNELFDVPTIVGLAARLEKLRDESQGGIDTVESTLAMIENLSDEEVKRMLAEVGG
jgi:acyl transferase domain-containing protein/acyl carrier protein